MTTPMRLAHYAIAVAAMLAIGGVTEAAAQAPARPISFQSSSARQTKPSTDSPWGIDLGVDLNQVSGATWWEVTPSVTRALDEHWTVEFGAPFRFVPGVLTDDGLSHAGLGDLYGSITAEVTSGNVMFNSALWGSAATGSATKGLGTGQAAFDWTNHIEQDFGGLTPYAEAGFSNSVDYATRISRNRIAGLTGATAASTGTLFNGELGTDLNFSDTVSLSVSGYITRGVGSQNLVTRTSGPRRQGTGRVAVLTTSNAGDDSGFASTLEGGLTKGVDFSVVFWRSNTYRYSSVSAGVTFKLAQLFK